MLKFFDTLSTCLHLSRHCFWRKSRFAFQIRPFQSQHAILQRRCDVQTIIPPYPTMMRPTTMARTFCPSFLTKPAWFTRRGYRIKFHGIGMQDNVVREAGNLTVVVTNAKMIGSGYRSALSYKNKEYRIYMTKRLLRSLA